MNKTYHKTDTKYKEGHLQVLQQIISKEWTFKCTYTAMSLRSEENMYILSERFFI